MALDNRIKFFVVVGGGDADPDPMEAGRVRLRDLTSHGPLVKDEDIPFSQIIMPPGSGQYSFNRPPPEGTIIVGTTPSGFGQTGYVVALGLLPGIMKSEGGIPGNESLPFMKNNRDKKHEIRLPPDVEDETEDNRTGIEKLTKKITEKGEEFALSVYDELQSHGALMDFAGIRNNPLQNITTALDQGMMVLNSGLLGQLVSGTFNLKSLLSQIQKFVPSELQPALNNLMKIIPNDLGGKQPASGASFGNIANIANLVASIENDVKNVKNISDLLNVIRKVSNSSALAGSLEGMDNIPFAIDTMFGQIKMLMKPDGSLESIVDKAIEQLKQIFMSQVQQIPGASQAISMFTQNGVQIPELIDRMVDQEKAKKMQQFLDKLKTEQNEAKRRGRETGPENSLGVSTRDIKQGRFTDAMGNIIEYNNIRRDR